MIYPIKLLTTNYYQRVPLQSLKVLSHHRPVDPMTAPKTHNWIRSRPPTKKNIQGAAPQL